MVLCFFAVSRFERPIICALPFLIVMAYGMTNEVKYGRLADFKIDSFQTVLADELIPYIDSNFRTAANQAHRAMAGLSMGGMETHSVTLNRPELFSYFALLSGGVYKAGEIKDKSKVKLVFLSCGSRENPERIQNAVSGLKEAGFNAVYFVSEKTGHEFQTWRRSIKELAPLLFKE